MFTTAKYILEHDPAAHSLTTVLLTSPGLHALFWHRIAHYLAQHRHFLLAELIGRHAFHRTGINISPEAQIGHQVFIDHGVDVVIGATAVIEDQVTILHGVTLGARRNVTGQRHPIVQRGAYIGAHAQILGPVIVGAHSKVGAAAVVLQDVPRNATVVGNPAHLVHQPTSQSFTLLPRVSEG
ncbi:serine O-acetyltransferase EpsC [Levilactobacillus spicheri]|uniref:Serine acetyltransferase n=1 Tax=Levilactobacillus spicheri TaxID=216463 RepID=A0A0F3RRN9_9LACO|nr:serine O-acetyltransferase EpsC [Levilactobacillus spicheri]KJW12555.1 serine acetyltransferase [Levilactobacillus spicheri]